MPREFASDPPAAAGRNVCASVEDSVLCSFDTFSSTYPFVKVPRDTRRGLSNGGCMGQKKLTGLLVCRK